MNKKTMIITGVVAFVLIALAVGGYFYWKISQKPQEKTLTASEPVIPEVTVDLSESATQGILPSLSTNPLEDKPNINPADKTNPFANIETNPFK